MLLLLSCSLAHAPVTSEFHVNPGLPEKLNGKSHEALNGARNWRATEESSSVASNVTFKSAVRGSERRGKLLQLDET